MKLFNQSADLHHSNCYCILPKVSDKGRLSAIIRTLDFLHELENVSFLESNMGRKRARIEDVIRLTGLSRSTIDRVLNGRPGVRSDTLVRVERALAELGFAANAMSARGIIKHKVVRIFLSKGTNPFFVELQNGIEANAKLRKYDDLRIHFHSFDPYRPETVAESLREVSAETTSVVTVGVESPETVSAINDLESRGIRVITIVSDVPMSKRSAYVGQDNFGAGRTAGRLMAEIVGSGEGDIAVLVGHLQFRHLLDRLSGFQEVIGLARSDLSVVQTKPYGTDPDQAREIIATLEHKHPKLKGVYLSGGGQPHLIEALSGLSDSKLVIIGHELTASSRTALANGTYKSVIAHDVHELGRKAIDLALSDAPPRNMACGVNVYFNENLPIP